MRTNGQHGHRALRMTLLSLPLPHLLPLSPMPLSHLQGVYFVFNQLAFLILPACISSQPHKRYGVAGISPAAMLSTSASLKKAQPTLDEMIEAANEEPKDASLQSAVMEVQEPQQHTAPIPMMLLSLY